MGSRVQLAAALLAVAALTVVGHRWWNQWREIISQSAEVEARQQFLRGESVYRSKCSQCHEAEGGIGPLLSREVLASYRTAGALLDYTKLAMPYDAPRTMPEQEYWDAVAYLLRSRDLLTDGVPLDSSSAEEIVLE